MTLTMTNTVDTKFPSIEVCFTDQAGKELEMSIQVL